MLNNSLRKMKNEKVKMKNLPQLKGITERGFYILHFNFCINRILNKNDL